MYISSSVKDKVRRAVDRAVAELDHVQGIEEASRATIAVTVHESPVYSAHCTVAVSTTCDYAPLGLRDQRHAGRLGFCYAETVKTGDVLLFPAREVQGVIPGTDPFAQVELNIDNSSDEQYDPDAMLLVFRPDAGYTSREQTCEQCGAECDEPCDPFCLVLPALGDAMTELLASNQLMLDNN